MKKSFFTLSLAGIFVLASFLLISCGPSLVETRGKLYPKMYDYAPASIVIMPPINQTNTVEAADYLHTSLAVPLMERGYYVFSPNLSMELLQAESAADAERFIDSKSLTPFANVFGADAVLFTKITKWNKHSVLSRIEVEIEYILKSTKDASTLFNRKVDLVLDQSQTISGGGLLGLLGNMAVTALTEKITVARKANIFVLNDLPSGKYRPDFGKDQEVKAYTQHLSHVTVK